MSGSHRCTVRGHVGNALGASTVRLVSSSHGVSATASSELLIVIPGGASSVARCLRCQGPRLFFCNQGFSSRGGVHCVWRPRALSMGNQPPSSLKSRNGSPSNRVPRSGASHRVVHRFVPADTAWKDPPPHVRQRYDWDCGVAVVATVGETSSRPSML